MKSIIQHLGSQEFPRLRLGVGAKPERMDLADYVLGHFSAEEKPLVEAEKKEACEAVECFLESGIREAMNRYNAKKKKEDIPEE